MKKFKLKINIIPKYNLWLIKRIFKLINVLSCLYLFIYESKA